MESDLKYLNALAAIPSIGSQKMTQLMNALGSAQKAWEASLPQLEKSGIGPASARMIADTRSTLDPDKLWDDLEKEKIVLLTLNDKHYPLLLKEIHNPPYILYAKGNLGLLSEAHKGIAVVGSRKFTPYGQQAAYALSHDCAKSNVVIVSGLALGIDAIAHRGALDAKGKTIAVLGNSLDDASIHPRNNFFLAQEIIASGGLLLSEYPIGTPGNPGLFPARNRIMAGLTKGTLVIEAALESGSLITSSYAVEYNRDVYAVPGQINSTQSEGTNKLIQAGAKLVTSAKDILEEFSPGGAKISPAVSSYEPANDEEEKILSKLSHEPTYIDIITKLTKLETSTISSALAMLEIKGAVKNVGGQNYIRI